MSIDSLTFNKAEAEGSIADLEAAVVQDEELTKDLSRQLYADAAEFLRKNGKHQKGKFDSTSFGITPQLLSTRRETSTGFTLYTEDIDIGIPATEEKAEIRIVGIGEHFSTILLQVYIPGQENDVLLLGGSDGRLLRNNQAQPINSGIIQEYLTVLQMIAAPNRATDLSLRNIA